MKFRYKSLIFFIAFAIVISIGIYNHSNIALQPEKIAISTNDTSKVMDIKMPI